MSGGHTVVIDGRPVTYLTPADEVPVDRPAPAGFDHFEDMTLRDHARLRRVLTTLIGPEPVFAGWLHWSDGTDLAALDEHVRAGDPHPPELDGALHVESRSFWCTHCGAGLRGVVPDGGHPLNTTERLRAHRFVERCPVCHEPLGMLVADIVEEPLEELIGEVHPRDPGR